MKLLWLLLAQPGAAAHVGSYASPLFVKRVLVVFSLFSKDVASFCSSPATGYPPRVENAVSRARARTFPRRLRTPKLIAR